MFVLEAESAIHAYEGDPNADFAMMACFHETPPGLPMGFGAGGEAETPEQPLVVSFELPPRRWPHLFMVTTALVASQSLRKIVDELAPGVVQWLPVTLTTPTAPTEPHFVMNVVTKHACLDRENSVVTDWKKIIVRMKHLVLDESRLPVPRPHLFVLAEMKLIVLVSDELANALSALDGVRVTPATGWGDGHLF